MVRNVGPTRKNALKLSVAIFVCLLTSSLSVAEVPTHTTWCDEGAKDPRECVQQIVEQWKKRGLYHPSETNTQLCKAFVIHPELFLEAMSIESQAYIDWRNTIAEMTFTIHDAPGSLEGQLKQSYLETLLDRMISVAQEYRQHETYGHLAQAILDELRGCRVSYSTATAGSAV